MNLPGWQDWVVDVLVDLGDSLPQMLAQLGHILAMRESLKKTDNRDKVLKNQGTEQGFTWKK